MATPEHMLTGWEEFEAGAVLNSFDGEAANRKHSPFNSFEYHVADWRVDRPVFNEDHCIHCQFCWVYCPDTAILSKDKKFDQVDYNHCKGCGICVEVCPTNPKSLLMFPEKTPDEKAIAQWPAKETSKDA
jgi:pyruvate ferredoxin oxidoreductase delta subunit